MGALSGRVEWDFVMKCRQQECDQRSEAAVVQLQAVHFGRESPGLGDGPNEDNGPNSGTVCLNAMTDEEANQDEERRQGNRFHPRVG